MDKNPNLVKEIRQQIDNLDNKVHDLLMERASLVMKIGEAKRKSNTQVVQPDREAIMIRRLLTRHKGPLPKEAVVRIWRELVGAVSLLQTGLKVVVTVPEDDGLQYWDMSKDYFSSVLPMSRVVDPLAALAAVRENKATFGVVPWPVSDEQNPWWIHLIDKDGSQPLRIMGRLPLGNRNNDSLDAKDKALVVAQGSFDPSGNDRSFLALDISAGVSRSKIFEKAEALSLKVLSIYSFLNQEEQLTRYLIEVEDYVSEEDEKLSLLLQLLGQEDGRCTSLGGYPTPPVYHDKVGKGAEEINQIEKVG
jgi:chorismate mutase-like protein